MATKTPAKKAPAKKAPAAPVVDLTPIDDGVTIVVLDAHAEVKVVGTFDLDGMQSVTKRLARATAELS